MPKKRNLNLLIIGNLHSHPSCEAFLRKFLKILYPISNCIFLISGDLPSDFQNKVLWIKTAYKKDSDISTFVKYINFIINQFRVILYMYKIFTKDDFFVLIFLTPHPFSMLFAKLAKKKILLYRGGIIINEMFPNENYFERFLFLIFFEEIPCKLSDKLILESKRSLEFQGIDKYKSKVTFCSLYVDSDLFDCKKMFNKREEIIGFIGILNENKGVDRFLKANIIIRDYLKKKGIEVIIGGNGPLFTYLKELIETNILSTNVTFLGWIAHEKISYWLNELKLLVLPSYSEGLPNIILEAMACCTPVLATPVGSIPDVIVDEKTGFIMEDNSPECIAKNIIRALEHPKLDEIAIRAKKIVENEFTYEAAVDRYRKMLKNFE